MDIDLAPLQRKLDPSGLYMFHRLLILPAALTIYRRAEPISSGSSLLVVKLG
jgi:hypothetical protein